MDRLVIVSADGHASAPLEEYRPYLEQRYHAALDDLMEEDRQYIAVLAAPRRPSPESLAIFDDRGAVAEGGETGAYDVSRRLSELDADGIAAELILPGTQCQTTPFFGPANRPQPPDVRAAGARAHNRWLADWMAPAGGRLRGVFEPGPCLDMEVTITDLHWASENGFASVTVPGSPPEPSLPPLHDVYWEPFWTACEDLDLVLSVHAGWGRAQGEVWQFFEMMNANGITELDTDKLTEIFENMSMMDDSPFLLDMGPRRLIWQLILGGAFDRHPRLKLALTEVRADWLPATLARLDARLDTLGSRLSMKPSEYFRQHCAVTPSSIHRAEVEARYEIGVDQLLFGADYPHPEGTWPNTRDWFRVAFDGVPLDEVKQIVGGNAIDLYGYDRALLSEVASRIGPEVDDVLGGGTEVPVALLEHFHKRSGYARPLEDVKVDVLDRTLDEDLAAVGAVSAV